MPSEGSSVITLFSRCSSMELYPSLSGCGRCGIRTSPWFEQLTMTVRSTGRWKQLHSTGQPDWLNRQVRSTAGTSETCVPRRSSGVKHRRSPVANCIRRIEASLSWMYSMNDKALQLQSSGFALRFTQILPVLRCRGDAAGIRKSLMSTWEIWLYVRSMRISREMKCRLRYASRVKLLWLRSSCRS